jgi:hypothetical protein
MYIGPWQEFRLAKLLRMSQQPEHEPAQRYFSSSPSRYIPTNAKSRYLPGKHSPEIGYDQTKDPVRKPKEIYFQLPIAYQASSSKHSSRHSSDLSSGVQTDSSFRQPHSSYRDNSRLSYTEDYSSSISPPPFQKYRPAKQLSTVTPRESVFRFPSLHLDNEVKMPGLSFENSVIRQNYAPHESTQPKLKGKFLKRRSRKV